jgi:toxin-antitoxin system PIN domain toxin
VTFLLDVDLVIALVDPAHVGHDAAHRWFATTGGGDWATCPLTENGVIRIVGNPRYPNSVGSPAAAAPIVARLREHPGHSFWADDISLVASDLVSPGEIGTSAQVTDTYLLALAAAHSGTLATFDRRLSVKAVHGGRRSLHVVDGA